MWWIVCTWHQVPMDLYGTVSLFPRNHAVPLKACAHGPAGGKEKIQKQSIERANK